MGVGNAIESFVQKLKHTVWFFVTGIFLLFAAGTWYGMEYAATKMFWWPTYLLAGALVVYIILDLKK